MRYLCSCPNTGSVLHVAVLYASTSSRGAHGWPLKLDEVVAGAFVEGDFVEAALHCYLEVDLFRTEWSQDGKIEVAHWSRRNNARHWAIQALVVLGELEGE